MTVLGISSWTVPWSIGLPGYPAPHNPLDAFGLLAKAAEANVTRLQIADNLPLDRLVDHELDRLRFSAQERGLTLEAGTRGVDPEHLRRYILIANRIGAPLLRTVLSGRLLGAEQLASTEASIRAVIPLLEENGVALVLENNEAFSASQYSELLARISHPRVGACLDTANSLGRPETLETVVEHLAPYVAMLHAKDYDIRRIDTRMGFSIVGTPAGEGRVDFPWVLTQLRSDSNQNLSVILEHWPPFDRDIQTTVALEERWLVASLGFLRSALSSPAEPTP